MRNSLSVKIIFGIVVISLIFNSIFGFFQFSRYENNLKSLYTKKAEAIVFALDSNIKKEEDFLDKSVLLINMQKHIWLDPDIINISINLPKDDSDIFQNYISTKTILADEILDEINKNAYLNDKFMFKDAVINNEQILRIAAPIHASGNLIGVYQIDLNLESINKIVKSEKMLFIIFLFFTTLFFIVFIALFIKIVIIKRIENINIGVLKIAKGDLDNKIEVKSKDEVGSLAKAFNEMANDLRKSNKKIKEYSHDLEKKVLERTKELEGKNEMLEKFNSFAVNRELKMVKLKKKIKELERNR